MCRKKKIGNTRGVTDFFYVRLETFALKPGCYCEDDVLLLCVVCPAKDLGNMLENSAYHNYFSFHIGSTRLCKPLTLVCAAINKDDLFWPMFRRS